MALVAISDNHGFLGDGISAKLCEFCSSISFDSLRLPTAGQLRGLSIGLDITGKYPFKRDLDGPDTEWELGPMKRIKSSAGQCNLCRAVSCIYDDIDLQHPAEGLNQDLICSVLISQRGFFKPENIRNISPTVPENMGLGVEQARDLRPGFR